MCAGPKELKPLGQGCRVLNGTDRGPKFFHSMSIGRLAIPQVSFVQTYNPQIHSNCFCNQEIAARNRVLGDVPPPSANGLRKLASALKSIARRAPPLGPQHPSRMLEAYGGPKRRRYEKGLRMYNAAGVCRRDARATGFVKTDKFNPEAKANPDPRMIQYRTPQYCVALGQWLKPLEHWFYTNCNWGAGIPAGRVVAKGLNPQQRGDLIAAKFRKFRRCRVLSLDASRFDQHVSRELLEREHSFYLRVLRNPRELRSLLSWQLDNTTRCSRGYQYACRGRRLSGDMNTAIGNCVLMIGMLSSVMRELDVSWDLLDDGDDCLLFVEEDDLQHVLQVLPREFLEFGMELRVDKVASSIEEVVFCQGHPVLVGKHYVMAPEPSKVLSQTLCGLRFGLSRRLDRAMTGTLGVAYSNLYSGVPILAEFSKCLVRWGGSPSKFAWEDESQRFKYTHWCSMKKCTVEEPDGAARESFHKAYGIDPGQQVQVERELRGMVLKFPNYVDRPHEWVNPGWNRVSHSVLEHLHTGVGCGGGSC